jgi:hypothetical protein
MHCEGTIVFVRMHDRRWLCIPTISIPSRAVRNVRNTVVEGGRIGRDENRLSQNGFNRSV